MYHIVVIIITRMKSVNLKSWCCLLSFLCWGIFSGIEWNENGLEIAAVAYPDCIHELMSITFIVFIKNTHLPCTLAHNYTVAMTS